MTDSLGSVGPTPTLLDSSAIASREPQEQRPQPAGSSPQAPSTPSNSEKSYRQLHQDVPSETLMTDEQILSQVEEMLAATKPLPVKKQRQSGSYQPPQLPVTCLGLGCQLSFKLSQVAQTCQNSEACWRANLDAFRSQLRDRAVSPQAGADGNFLG